MRKQLALLKSATAVVLMGTLISSSWALNNEQHFTALSEYWTASQKVLLKFNSEEEPCAETELHLENGLVLTYADIISLGDLYGIVGRPISHGITENQRQVRFKDAYNSLATDPKSVNEAMKLNQIIKNELAAVEDGIKDGEPVEVIYSLIGNKIGRQINCATGGGCNQYTWWLYPGRYIKLALEDFDHYTPNNLVAYEQGHRAALTYALKARISEQRVDLERAYAMEAFAAHFLSDQFTAGHLRTPREELSKKATPATLGSMLANYMQEEENRYGIHVHNSLGTEWVVYGNSSFFNSLNNVNRTMLLQTLQQSANEVFDVFSTGAIPEHYAAMDMIPLPEPLISENSGDIAPMFYWNEKTKQLLRRTVLANPYDTYWTTNWWSWSTLMLLKNQYGIYSTLQLSLTRYISSFAPSSLRERLNETQIAKV